MSNLAWDRKKEGRVGGQSKECMKKPYEMPLSYKLIGNALKKNFEQRYPTWVNATHRHQGYKWNSLYQLIVICLGGPRDTPNKACHCSCSCLTILLLKTLNIFGSKIEKMQS